MVRGEQVSWLARCKDCDWSNATVNARQLAQQYSSTRGHRTNVEITRVYMYEDGNSKW